MRENILAKSTFLAPSVHNPLAQTTITMDNMGINNNNNLNNNNYIQQQQQQQLPFNVMNNNNLNNNKMEIPSISPRNSMFMPAFSPKGSGLLPVVGPQQVREEQISHFNRTLLQTWVDGDIFKN